MNFDEPVQGHLHWTVEEYNDSKKEVMKTIIILSVVTIAEVGIAIAYDKLVGDGGGGKMIINMIMAIASIIKVYFIMGTFMHLKHEKKWFIITVFAPFSFLIWAIIAFSVEGAYWETMRGWINLF
ncbi:MAG TPA: cytochrome C oxidase subunit IV family protein [Chitinophagales bacterium]|nr:cytochrome C oxidase subunit IV family protein [Chitinophagales bacterium]